MALTNDAKVGLGLLLAMGALLGLAGLGINEDDEDDEEDDFDDFDDFWLPAGRGHELEVLAVMERRYPRREILDNPVYAVSNGSSIRPDVVVLDEDDEPLEVREAKDVALLRPSHVFQASHYDAVLQPRNGTTLDVAADTIIPDNVAELAAALGIFLKRHR